MAGEKTVSEQVAPLVATVIAADGVAHASAGAVAVTPGSAPNIRIQVVQPLVAIVVRFGNVFLTTLVTLTTAGMTTSVIPATDFWHLVLKCATLSVATAGIGLGKDCITVFGRLETKYPLLTGSV